MSLVIKTLVNAYIYAFELADPRVEDWLFMNTPMITLGIIFVYLYTVLEAGPKFMQHRKPYNIDTLLIYYNVFQILGSAYVFLGLLRPILYDVSWHCTAVNYSNSPNEIKTLKVLWFYYVLKIIDLLDTIFFVMRKKANQVSFLHVYHHFGMVCITWIGVKFLGGGTSIYLPFVNSLVHVIMYFYYLLSTWDKSYKMSVWWKKYITQIQLAQFFFLFVTFSRALLNSQCTYPKWILIIICIQNLFITSLFLDFYIRTYIKTKKRVNTLNSSENASNSVKVKTCSPSQETREMIRKNTCAR